MCTRGAQHPQRALDCAARLSACMHHPPPPIFATTETQWHCLTGILAWGIALPQSNIRLGLWHPSSGVSAPTQSVLWHLCPRKEQKKRQQPLSPAAALACRERKPLSPAAALACREWQLLPPGAALACRDQTLSSASSASAPHCSAPAAPHARLKHVHAACVMAPRSNPCARSSACRGLWWSWCSRLPSRLAGSHITRARDLGAIAGAWPAEAKHGALQAHGAEAPRAARDVRAD